MADVFISYSREDISSAKQIAIALAERGWSVWWDRTIPVGEDFYDVIDRELDSAHCVVVLWSEYSAASRWVRAEATEALQQGKLVPVILGECRLPLVFRQIQGVVISTGTNITAATGFDTLLADIARRLARIQEVMRIPVIEPTEQSEGKDTIFSNAHCTEALDAFLEGVDIGSESIEIGSFKHFFREIGSMFRVFASETANALRAIEQARATFRISQTVIGRRENNPLRFSLSHEDAVRGLLLNRGDGFMKPLDAATEAMETVQYHPLAQLAAVQAILVRLVDSLDPEALDKSAQESSKSWITSPGKKAIRFVTTYRKVYASLREQMENYGLPFAHEFGREYDRQMQLLRSKSTRSE